MLRSALNCSHFLHYLSIHSQVDLSEHTTSVHSLDFYSINPKGNLPCIVFSDGSLLNENCAVLLWIADQSAIGGRLAPPPTSTERYQLINTLSFIATELHARFGGLFNESLNPDAKGFFKSMLCQRLRYLDQVVLARCGRGGSSGSNGAKKGLGNGAAVVESDDSPGGSAAQEGIRTPTGTPTEKEPTVAAVVSPPEGADAATAPISVHHKRPLKYLVGNALSVADLYLHIVLSWSGHCGVDLAPYPMVRAYQERISADERVVAGKKRIAMNPETTN